MGAELLSLGNNRAHTAGANERPLPLSPVGPGLRPEELLGFNQTVYCVRGPTALFFLCVCSNELRVLQCSYTKFTVIQKQNVRVLNRNK